MSDSMEVALLKQQIYEMEKDQLLTQSMITSIALEVIDLIENGEEDEAIEILKQLTRASDENEEEEDDG
jgi:hypothetical protein